MRWSFYKLATSRDDRGCQRSPWHFTSTVPQIYNWCAQIMSQQRTVEVRYRNVAPLIYKKGNDFHYQFDATINSYQEIS
jgi:hypothetical protein